MVRLTPSAWRAELDARPELAGLPPLADWAANGWPLVARRRCAGDREDAIPLGLPLPPAFGKRRLAFAVPRHAIVSVEPPPPLAALCHVPQPWRATVAALVALGHRVEPRVFGSFAFAHFTGLDYLTPASDLDLIWPVEAAALLGAVAGIEAHAPGRIDGEVIRAGHGVNWRELASGGEVLAKSLDGVALVDAAVFLGRAAAA